MELTTEFKMTSLDLVKVTGKRHDNILKDIKDEIEKLGERGLLIFEGSEYKNSQNKSMPMYILTKKGAMQIGARYSAEIRYKLIDYAEKLEKAIKEKSSTEWLQTRAKGKMIRKQTTDAIQDYLIPLAIEQGSNNSGKLFMTYSKLVNMTCDIRSGQRDNLKDDIIMYLSFLEDFIQKIIIEEVEKSTHYKEIYKICKEKCALISEINPPRKDKYIIEIETKQLEG